MATDTSIGSTTPKVDRSKLPQQGDKFTQMKTEDYIKLMVTELQNQDPLNPMDNSQMLQQVSQISAIQSNNSLSSTLTSMSLGESLAAASSMIGKGVIGKTEDGTAVQGIVDSASIKEGKAYLNVPNEDGSDLLQLPLTNVSQIL